jgi:hypothetical protein
MSVDIGNATTRGWNRPVPGNILISTYVRIGGGSWGRAMTMNDLPAIMGTVLIVAGLALVGINAWFRADGREKTTQAGALIIVVGAFLLGLSIFGPHAK